MSRAVVNLKKNYLYSLNEKRIKEAEDISNSNAVKIINQYTNMPMNFNNNNAQFNEKQNNNMDKEELKKTDKKNNVDSFIDLSKIADTHHKTHHTIVNDDIVDELASIDLKYPLTPANPKGNEYVFSWVNIRWNTNTNSLDYIVHEPALSKTDEYNLVKIKKIIEEKLNIHFESVHKKDAITYLKKLLNEIIVNFGFMISKEKLIIYEYYILRDFIGMGKLQPIMNDSNIEDISCDG
ncbi:MAG: hypothetical protein KAS12_02655, partial [Candidatus Aenigmarchaeota archaeon]|nr:hypothetical protein [Candidatus Aenigmarchaeota archaeon]